MEIETSIKADSLYKNELARKYNLSVRHLMRSITKCKELNSKLIELGYVKTDKMFTKKMVEQIFYFLGEPC